MGLFFIPRVAIAIAFSFCWRAIALHQIPLSPGLPDISNALSCSPTAIPHPEVYGIEILSLSAVEVGNLSISISDGNVIYGDNPTSIHFCNVTVAYTHPGWNDLINAHIWLPVSGWNGRFQGAGGGGWATGYPDQSHPQSVAQGFAVGSTDGGHTSPPSSWALVSPGNVDLYLLQDFASRGIHEMTLIGKAITESFYGVAPAHSYWFGCSTGGRQGLMLAQRYPEDYDGIVAIAPAINWDRFVVSEYWPQFIMNRLGVYPSQCEFEAITAAAIEACDGLDGVIDGLISSPNLCDFDAATLVDKTYDCLGTTKTFTAAAATIAQAAWNGPVDTTGSSKWYGLNKDASLIKLAGTVCDESGVCTGSPFFVSADWISLFVEKNPDFNFQNMTLEKYERVLHDSSHEYASIIGTADPDLSLFRRAGGKMISWHGLTDELIFPNGTVDYYNRVLELDPNASDFYRFFEAPGTDHCAPGPGPFPVSALDDVIKWVEEGIAPMTLTAKKVVGNDMVTRNLCPYPSSQKYIGGDPNKAASFGCQ